MAGSLHNAVGVDVSSLIWCMHSHYSQTNTPTKCSTIINSSAERCRSQWGTVFHHLSHCPLIVSNFAFTRIIYYLGSQSVVIILTFLFFLHTDKLTLILLVVWVQCTQGTVLNPTQIIITVIPYCWTFNRTLQKKIKQNSLNI